MNPDLARLQPYPFEKLRALLADSVPSGLHSPISLSIGEPRRASPSAARQALIDSLDGLASYPGTAGTEALRETIARWLVGRYGLDDVEVLARHHVLPVNGTREALFAIAQCVLDRNAHGNRVLMPNPFYQIYEGATLLAGCSPAYYAIDGDADDNLAAIDPALWPDCQMIYLCNPGNPTGAVISKRAQQQLIELAHEHDFVIVSDECYSEIYREAADAPCGLLQAAHDLGLTDFSRCLAFHSLSKRSNLPGLRSGFVAGDAGLIERFLLYRTYHGCSMSPPVQQASIAAWRDEEHVRENRRAYDASYRAVIECLQPVLPLETPPGGFYLWPRLPSTHEEDDQQFCRRLLEQGNVRIVPGSYLARAVDGHNPGTDHVRMALVASTDDCRDAARRIRQALS